MAYNVSYIYSIKDKYSAVADRVRQKNKSVTKSFGDLKKKVGAVGDKMSSLGKNLSLKVSAPLLAIGGFALRSAAQIETLGVAFESMTGSVAKSKQVVKGLISFAAKTPFQLVGIGKAAKQLLAAGVKVIDLQGKLKFLGDIAAGANVPLSDMASIFAKAKAKGKAMTEELLQLSDRGIPIIDVLSKSLGVAKGAVFDLASKGKISFSILQKAMISMSKKGGVFADQMKKQSNTLAGVWSTLKDNVGLALASLGDQLVKTFDLKNTINTVIGAIQRGTAVFVNFTKENPKLAKMGIIIAGLATVAGPLLVTVGLAAAAFAALSVPILISSAAIMGIGVAIAAIIVFWDDLKQAMQNVLDFWSGGFLAGISKVGAAVKDIIGLIPDLFSGGGEINVNAKGGGVAARTMTNNSRLDGQININAAPGTVKSIESRQSGSNVGNLGFNLAGAPL
jgi:tape measure domain-containing protein